MAICPNLGLADPHATKPREGGVLEDYSESADDTSCVSEEVKESHVSSDPNKDRVSSLARSDRQIIIEPDILQGMSGAARKKFKECVEETANDLAKEASRLELTERGEGLKQEINATMVSKAYDLIRQPPIGQASTRISALIAQLVAFAGNIFISIIPSFGAPYLRWTATAVCVIMTLPAAAYAIFSVRRR